MDDFIYNNYLFIMCFYVSVFTSYRISYCPKSVGKYSIHVLDSEQNTAGKPIKVDVFDPNMIKLSKIGDAVLGQDNRIRVDTGNTFYTLNNHHNIIY